MLTTVGWSTMPTDLVRIELNIEDELEALGLSDMSLLAPVDVWFSGSSTADIVVEFEVVTFDGD